MINYLSLKCSHFFKSRYNLLLFSIICLYIFRPWNELVWYPIFWKFLFTGVLLTVVFKCEHIKAIKLLAIIIAIPSLFLSWGVFLLHSSWIPVGANLLSTLLLILCSSSIIRDVIAKKSVSFDILKGVVCAYLLIACIFAHFYWITEFFIPGSLAMSKATIPILSYTDYLSELSYFSLTTILSMPFGDILPSKSVAETLFVIEGVLGQFYLIMLVARLVSIHSLSLEHKISSLSIKKKHPFKAHYNLLLISLFSLYIFRPYSPSAWYLGCWKILLTLVILLSIFNRERSKPLKIVETILSFPAIIFSWLALFCESHWFDFGNAIFTSLFVFLCAISIIRNVLLDKNISFETLRGAVCAYFLACVGFAYLFWGVEFLNPETFFISNQSAPIFSSPAFLSEMLSFSLIAFLTINTGDIIPVKPLGQTLVVINGVLGQFYMAILVSRLVALYTKRAHQTLLKSQNAENKSSNS